MDVNRITSFLKNCRCKPIDQISEMIKRINEFDLETIGDDELLSAIDDVTVGLLDITVGLPSKGHTIFRGRKLINDELFTSIRELVYPPRAKTPSGRANAPFSPILYASAREEEIYSELSLQEGESLIVITCESIAGADLTFSVIGQVLNVARTDRPLFGSDDNAKVIREILQEVRGEVSARTVLLDAFVAEQFRTPAKNEYEYRISNTISRRYWSRSRVDGIVYPSVAHFGGINFAIRPDQFDRNYKVVKCEARKVLGAYGYGIFYSVPYAKSISISEDGGIHWNKQR